MIDREHVFGLRNEAGEGAEDVAGVRRWRQRQLPRRAFAVGLNVPGGSKGDDSWGVELRARLARFAGVRSPRELRCWARRRQTSVRATRLRFYATTSASLLGSWLLSPTLPPHLRQRLPHPLVHLLRPLSFYSSSSSSSSNRDCLASFLSPQFLTFLSYPPYQRHFQ